MIRYAEGPISPLHPLTEPQEAPVAHPPMPTAVTAAAVPAEPNRKQIEQAVAQANSQMTAVAPSLQFEIDPDTRDVVIRLVDRQDQRVLRQVPSVEMVAISQALERMHSLLVRTRA